MSGWRRSLFGLLGLIAAAAALAAVWWGWQAADAGMLLLGTRLC